MQFSPLLLGEGPGVRSVNRFNSNPLTTSEVKNYYIYGSLTEFYKFCDAKFYENNRSHILPSFDFYTDK